MVFAKVISEGVEAVAAGSFHNMVLKRDSQVWATGLNQDGQIGDGTTITKEAFVEVSLFGNCLRHNGFRVCVLSLIQAR